MPSLEQGRFRYEPVDPGQREIRVFKLQPALSRDAPICGDLIIRSIDNRPRYDALSYVWGVATPPVTVWLGGFPFSVTPNLANALLDLRQQREPLLLWVDALCIDQANATEREHQVSMMGDIYSRAHIVHAWLNEHIDPTSEAFRESQRLMVKSVWSPGEEDFTARSLLILAIQVVSYLFYYCTGVQRELKSDKSFWGPLIRIFNNEYWTRLWIQQEILLARKVVFHCREHILPERGLLRFQSAVQSHNNGVRIGDYRRGDEFDMSIPGFFNTLIEGREHVKRSRATGRSNGQDTDLPLLLFLDSTNLRVTDPRDRVYGCLGLLSGDHTLQLKPDYCLSLVQVYSQVFRNQISVSSKLDFLCVTFDRNGVIEHNLPTWMPAPEKGSIFAPEKLQRHACASSAPSEQAATISQDGMVLSVQGIHVDTIRSIGKHELIRMAPIMEWAEDVLVMNKEMDPSDITPGGPWEKHSFLELFRMGCTDKTYWRLYNQVPPKDKDLSEVLKALVQTSRMPGKSDISLATLLEDEAQRGPNNDIILSMGEAVLGSSFFTTSATNQLGLVSCTNSNLSPRVGDMVYIVLGCPKSLILRPRGAASAEFSLVGAAVLPQMMDGSFADSLLRRKNGNTPVMNIKLI